MNTFALNKKTAVLFTVISGFLLMLPLRTLMTEYWSNRAAAILDDPATEGRDALAVTEETLPAYDQAIRSLRAASSLDPGNSRYHQALAEVYLKLAVWSEAMETMGGRSSRSSRKDFERSRAEIAQSIDQEPTNPDYHLALGMVDDLMGTDTALSAREYENAIGLYPKNSPLRFSVALRYLLSNRKTEALVHARHLAVLDDSYLNRDTVSARLARELRSPAYLAGLTNTYLYKSMEIAWRASDKDVSRIETMVPKNADAQEIWELFLERKGVGDPGGS